MTTATTWFVDVRTWDPQSPTWQRALATLPPDELEHVQRFVFAKDQKLALASRLLQRRLIHSVFRIPWDKITIARTPEGKPYWQRLVGEEYPVHWNYNVSHHGTVVAIAAHPNSLVGVDVVQLSERPRRRPQDPTSAHFFRAFTDHFTESEWKFIRQSSDEDAQFHAFYRLWSLKESYIKAIGIGLGFQLLRAEFTIADDSQADWTMRLDREMATQWRFQSQQVQATAGGDPHLVSLALGPVTEVWNPTTSSIFPAPHTPREAELSPVDFPANLAWQEKTLDELLHV